MASSAQRWLSRLRAERSSIYGPDGPIEREAEREEYESEHADDADIAECMADDWFLDPISWENE